MSKQKKEQPNEEQIAAIVAFAKTEGRCWKEALRTKWMNGTDANEADGYLLRQIRNNFGHTWLFKFRLPKT